MMAKFEEQKHLYYWGVNQKGYINGHDSGKCQKQYKPIDVSQMFSSLYCSIPKTPSPSSSIGRDILEIHAPIVLPQIDGTPQKLTSINQLDTLVAKVKI